MSDTSRGPGQSGRDTADERMKSRLDTEAGAARAEGEHAREHVKADAQAFGDYAKERAYEGADGAKQTVSSSLDDFAAAIRKASDELGERDQSMASHLVREVAGGLEQASRSIGGRDVGELTHSVAAFARERPGMFMAGMALVGLGLGRFVQASADHGSGRGGLRTGGSDRSSYESGRDGDLRTGGSTREPVSRGATTSATASASPLTGANAPTLDSASRSTLASPQTPARPIDPKTGDRP